MARKTKTDAEKKDDDELAAIISEHVAKFHSPSAAIHVWLDQTSDADCPTWIVSLEDGESSTTLSQHATRSAAVKAGSAAAEERGSEYRIED